jgi:non-homologous end joining protein Ku
MRNREHLAAVKASGPLLVMELMHFANEIAPAETIKVPSEKQIAAEKQMAKTTLVEQMSSEWQPERYKDEYTTALMKLIDEKIKAGGKEIPGAKRHAPGDQRGRSRENARREPKRRGQSEAGASPSAENASAMPRKLFRIGRRRRTGQ